MRTIGTRLIKARVWDEKSKRMFYTDEGAAFEWVKGKIKYMSFPNVLVEDGIVMLWTGLNDKEGRDVYEGDIVDMKCFDSKGEAGLCLIRHELFHRVGGLDYSSSGYYVNDGVVLGNAYENKELLGKLHLGVIQDFKENGVEQETVKQEKR